MFQTEPSYSSRRGEVRIDPVEFVVTQQSVCVCVCSHDQDSAGKEPSTNEDRLSVEEDGGGDVDTARSWAERVELSDPEN